ncbi:MAG: GNAT family N-acetyltransferase [Pseudobdellovibrionaceae bacterium]|jgi:predicted GNAT family acetyltransferase|nr:GNAT family N-acetyltransferase [Pseudobdellovibrionaceae bacterium]
MSPFRNNTALSRFEYHVGENFTLASYHIKEKTLFIDYVESPLPLRGTGAAGKLMQEIVTYAENKNLSIIPICGYAAAWLKKNNRNG